MKSNKSDSSEIAAKEISDPEMTTVWSFPKRGDWATHTPKFRGNFAPQIPRNIMMKYSEEEDLILDPMVGGGTTLIEAKYLNRNAIGFDINPEFVKQTKDKLKFKSEYKPKIRTYLGDIRSLSSIKNDTVDLIITHPPYLNIIKYSENKIKEDLSRITSPWKFCDEFEKGIKELYRVLKPDKYCAILIGDTRKARHYIPLAFMVMQRFLKCRFVLKEDIIKVQHNCASTPYWKSQAKKYNIYLIMHEHLFVFRKPASDKIPQKYKYSAFRNEVI